MPDATPIQITLINPTIFFNSHRTTFAEPTPSRAKTSYARSKDAVNNARSFEFTPLDILLKELESGYAVIKPIQVKIEEIDNAFVASFIPANIHASGETWDEAALNLKSLLLDIYDSLVAERPNALGLEPKRQLSILRSYIQSDR